MIEFDFTFYEKTYHATLGKAVYEVNQAPFIQVITLPTADSIDEDVEDYDDLAGEVEEFGDLTVNLFINDALSEMDPPCFAISHHVDHTGVPEALEAAGVITLMDETVDSGFATYRLARFAPGALESIQTLEELNEDIDAYLSRLESTIRNRGAVGIPSIDLASPQSVKEAIHSGIDLYNTRTGEFVFEYNDFGSIAKASIPLDDPALISGIGDDGFDLYESIVGDLNHTCYITDSNEALAEAGLPLPDPDDPSHDRRDDVYAAIASQEGWGPASPERIRAAIAAEPSLSTAAGCAREACAALAARRAADVEADRPAQAACPETSR